MDTIKAICYLLCKKQEEEINKEKDIINENNMKGLGEVTPTPRKLNEIGSFNALDTKNNNDIEIAGE